jgi:hypothetical protein
MDEAERLTFVCEKYYGGDWDVYYTAFGLHLAAFGAKAGVNEVPDKELDTKQYATYLENVVTTLSTLGIVTASKTSLKRNANSIIRAWRIMRKYAHFHEVEIKFRVCCICINA